MAFTATTTRESEGQLHSVRANGRMDWARVEEAAVRVLRQLPFYCVSVKLQTPFQELLAQYPSLPPL